MKRLILPAACVTGACITGIAAVLTASTVGIAAVVNTTVHKLKLSEVMKNGKSGKDTGSD